MKLIYLAGPYSDSRGEWYIEQNVRRSEEVALRLWQEGYAVISPHKNTKSFGGALTWEQCLQGDLEMLRRCDAIVMLPGWELSKGSIREKDFVHQLNGENDFIKVFVLRETYTLDLDVLVENLNKWRTSGN